MRKTTPLLTALLSTYPTYLPYIPAIEHLIQTTKQRHYTANPIISQTHAILDDAISNKSGESYLMVLHSFVHILLQQLNDEQGIHTYLNKYTSLGLTSDQLSYGLSVLAWYEVIDKKYRYQPL